MTQRPVLLGVTAYTSGPTEPPRGLHMLQRWLPLLLGCRPTREGSSMLCALGQATKSMDGPSPQGPGVEFSISVAGLVAEAVHLNVEGAITAKGAQ